MNHISHKITNELSDNAIENAIGYFIKHTRQQQRKTQEEIAQQAQLSRSTLSLLERGETVTLSTLIRVLRVLGQLQTLRPFEVKKQVSPLALAKLQKAERQRVRKSKKDNPPTPSDW